MPNVTLHIGGRDYAVACADGEESRLTALGATIEDKVRALGMTGQSEGRQLLFAALLLADELQEARGGAPSPSAASLSLAPVLEALAERLEKCATDLEC